MKSLETERLVLRSFTTNDKDDLVAMMTNPMVTRYLGDGSGFTVERAERMLERLITSWERGFGIFAVVLREGNTFIGYSGIQTFHDGRVELLYAFTPDAWGNGYATEAGQAVLAYARANFAVSELIALSYPQNPGSIGVIRKLGFTSIGQEAQFGISAEVFTLKLHPEGEQP